MRIVRRAGAILMAVTLSAGLSLPVAAIAGPTDADADHTIVAVTRDAIVRCPKISGKGKRKDCVMTADGTIRVVFGKGKRHRATEAHARMVVDAAREGMARYATMGFATAELASNSPLVIHIDAGYEDPEYSWKSGVVYISKGAAEALDAFDARERLSARMELWHEQFHWIEDEAYIMGAARLSGSRTWWIETAAELMTFLIDPDGAARNATLYGRLTLGTANASQFSPLQWPGDALYQHAQRLLYSIYGPDPVMTLSEFVTAVNDGRYPLADPDMRARFRAGLEGYAEYLLTGELPGFGTVEPIAAGTALGDYIGVIAAKRSAAGEGLQLVGSNDRPQIDRDAGTVTAVMQADSVYALAIASGPALGPWQGARLAARPTRLVVEPGPAVLFRIDGGPITGHDGMSELILEPIGDDGIGAIRLVAMAPEANTFRARIEPIELEPGGTAELVHTLRNLDASEQGTSELVCTYSGKAVLEMADGWWQVTYEGENWHGLSGARFVCGGGTGGAVLASGETTAGPLTFVSWGECDRDTLDFDGEVLSGTTYAACGDDDVYTWEVGLETLLKDD
jgi:hypothetical protein